MEWILPTISELAGQILLRIPLRSGVSSAEAEARSLLPCFLAGSTVEELRELISVAPKIKCALRAFARAHPENAAFIEKSLKSRCRVLEEFDRLLREGIPVADLQEVEEPESDAEETYAGAQP